MHARLAVVLLALVAPLAAAAGPRATDLGLFLGARVGWGEPGGRVERDGDTVADVVPTKVPIWLELGYRFTPHVRGELYFEIAPATVSDAYCASGDSCSASNYHFGLAFQLRLAPRSRFDPWIGAGFGVEVLEARVRDDPLAPERRSTLRWLGIELPLVEGGVDVALGNRFSLGPYAAVTFAQFTSRSRRPPGGSSTTRAVEDRDFHRWLQAGLKATLRL